MIDSKKNLKNYKEKQNFYRERAKTNNYEMGI